MAEKSASPVATATPEEKSPAKTATPKKAGAPKSKNPAAKPKTHPSTALMVKTAIKTLAERNGSSLQAIKKYIAATYKVDTEKHSQFIKKFLKSAVTDGSLVQVKGKGANGSFKLAVAKTTGTKGKPNDVGEKKAVKKSPTTAKKPAAKKTGEGKAVKKTASPKKEVKKVATGEKKAKVVVAKEVKPKISPKAKKATKAPLTAKPKAPKPKKVTAAKSPKAAPKKAAAKK